MMQLQGSTEGNMIAAVRSAVRLRDRPVHSDTINHWVGVLHHARRELADGAALPSKQLQRLVLELEHELAKRPA